MIGGGITGLAAAHRLVELEPALDVMLFEAGSRLGGVLETVKSNGFSLERSADNFITNVPWAVDLCRRIGFEDQLVRTNDTHRQAFVVRKGRLHKIPEGFLIMAPSRIWPVLTTPILSWRAKLRLAWEYFVPRCKSDDDESLASFAIRRLGRETYERLVQPLVGGIYTADPEKLSVKATMPRFLDMEREHGGLIRGAWKQAAARRSQDGSSSGARYSMFMTPRDGLTSLVDALAARLPEDAVRLNSPVEQLNQKVDGGWTLLIGGDTACCVDVDALILTTPAHRSARLLADIDSDLAAQLDRIPHTPVAIVSLGYQREQIGHPLDGFGFVVPHVENRKILSGSFSSVKYPGRAPDGCELIRVFIGGACQPELAELPDDQLRDIATSELRELLDIEGGPIFDHISRWPPIMPQYCLGHCELVEQIESRTTDLKGLHLAGNAYHGVGMPNCIHSGEQAAERIVSERREAPVLQ